MEHKTVQLDVGSAVAEYQRQNPRSSARSKRASAVMPGGTTRTTTFFPPFPPTLANGEGCHVTDVDGNRRVDFLNNYTSLILGHAHPEVLAAVGEVSQKGTAFAAPTVHEARLAEILCRRIESVERVRFTNSGTEATMGALRLARAFTGRERVALMEGAYHGTHDYATAPAAGVPDAVADLVVRIPFNDVAVASETIDRHSSTLAAVMVEPILGAGGVIPATGVFLETLRQATSAAGALLVFDEVLVFRIHYGGAQAHYGVRPDLTTLGKIIGGGFPIGAFGGRDDVMELLHPETGSISWGGTFNGNPVSAAAGVATLDILSADVIDGLNAAGDAFHDRMVRILGGSALSVTGIGSLFNLHADDRPDLLKLVHLELLNRGYFLAPRGMGSLSTPMHAEELDGLATAIEEIVRDLPGSHE